LENGKTDEPLIYPSSYLLQWLENFNAMTTPLDFSSASGPFLKGNTDIETVQNQMKNFMNLGNLKSGAGDKGAGRGRGRG